VIRSLASEAGVTTTRFTSDGKADELCILCGLCVRVCRELVGAAAIGFIGRGNDREVGSPFHLQSEACIGCGACAYVCPTGAVKIEDIDGQRFLHSWNTSVPLKPCPECGQPFAPEPMVFLRDLVEASEHLWGICPSCRRKQTLAQLDIVREAG
jgi:bidirectional [NiFe] hydrogenase diaphorase subunit